MCCSVTGGQQQHVCVRARQNPPIYQPIIVQPQRCLVRCGPRRAGWGRPAACGAAAQRRGGRGPRPGPRPWRWWLPPACGFPPQKPPPEARGVPPGLTRRARGGTTVAAAGKGKDGTSNAPPRRFLPGWGVARVAAVLWVTQMSLCRSWCAWPCMRGVGGSRWGGRCAWRWDSLGQDTRGLKVQEGYRVAPAQRRVLSMCPHAPAQAKSWLQRPYRIVYCLYGSLPLGGGVRRSGTLACAHACTPAPPNAAVNAAALKPWVGPSVLTSLTGSPALAPSRPHTHSSPVCVSQPSLFVQAPLPLLLCAGGQARRRSLHPVTPDRRAALVASASAPAGSGSDAPWSETWGSGAATALGAA